MIGKKTENSIEKIRAYIKARSVLGLKPVDIQREVCDIYGEGQMSHISVCRCVAKFMAGQQDLKDAARSGRPPTTTTRINITNLLNQDARYTARDVARLAIFFSKSPWHFRKTPEP